MRIALLSLLAGVACFAQRPCATPAHKALDGIIGEWEVREAGVATGHARFRYAVQGCAIVHDFTTPTGEEGKGLLYLDGKWNSIFVSPGGIEESPEVTIASTSDGFTWNNRSYRRGRFQPPPEVRQACQSANHRAFDFWEGKWDVFSPKGIQTGVNHIHRVAGGCALVENWTSAGLTNGMSINFWHEERRQWRQVWVAPGSVLRLAGAWNGGALLLMDPGRTRLSFTPNLDGTVRQYWEQTLPGAAGWGVAFDGTYRRAKEPGRETLVDALTRTAAGASPALEAFVHSQIAGLTSNTAFDPGLIEPFLGRLAHWTPSAPATGNGASLRARSIELARSHAGLRGTRSAHPADGTNLDGYQWLALAAEHSRRALPGPWRAWRGTWTGAGTFQGKPAQIELRAQPILDGKFDEVSITVTPASGSPFLGRAVYAADAATAHWNDSMANAYPIKAEWNGESLVALWADPVRGRSTYSLGADGRLSIIDEVSQKSAVFQRFAEYKLSKSGFR